MSKPKGDPQQTLPGMMRRPAVRRHEATPIDKLADGMARREMYKREHPRPAYADTPAGTLVGAAPEPPPPRKPYDDTRRGYAGAPHARTQPSYETAKAIAPAAANMRKKIYEYIHEQGGHGATPDEVRAALNMLITTVGPRFIELRERRKIFKVDETRPTQTGKPARVHVADEYVDTSDLKELER